MLTTQLSHSIYMVHSQTIHRHQGRSNYLQYGPCVTYINKVAIQQRLLIEFFYNPYIDSLLRALLACVIIGLCVQQLPQQLNSTIFWDSASCRLLFLLYSLSSLTKGSIPKVKKTYSWSLGLRDILARQRKLSWLFAQQHTHVYQLYHFLWMWQIVRFMQKACAAEFSCDLYMQSNSIVH